MICYLSKKQTTPCPVDYKLSCNFIAFKENLGNEPMYQCGHRVADISYSNVIVETNYSDTFFFLQLSLFILTIVLFTIKFLK